MSCECEKEVVCNGVSTSSNCVDYQGGSTDIPKICEGEDLTSVITKILAEIKKLIDRADQQLQGFNAATCPPLKEGLAGREISIPVLFQSLWDYSCTLRALIKATEERINAIENKTRYPFVAKCITPIPFGDSVNTDAYLQGAINKICDIESKIGIFITSVEKTVKDIIANYLGNGLVTSYAGWGINKIKKDDQISYQLTAMVPPFCAVAYFGPASNFDAEGFGIAGTAYEGWLFVNGLHNLPDARGRVLVGATKNIAGGKLDNFVDPNLLPGNIFGENFHALTNAEMPNHSHAVNDPGHEHSYRGYESEGRPCGSKCDREDSPSDSRTTSRSFTNITIGNTGGGQPHENRQPSLTITGWVIRLN